MIVTTVEEVDGVRFIASVRIIEPREKRNGVCVELVSRMISDDTGIGAILKGFGMKNVGRDLYQDVDIYAFYPWGYCQYKIAQYLFKAYWWLIRFLYDNARLFKEIPPGEMFSWRYLTPYRWMVSLARKIKNLRLHNRNIRR